MKKLMIAVVGAAMTAVLSGCFTAVNGETTRAKIEDHIASQLRAKAQSGKFYSKYQVPPDDILQKLAARSLNADELAELRELAEQITRNLEAEIVWPIWIETIRARVIPAAENLLAKGDYANAREVIWRASTTGVVPVDEGVRKFGYEFLNTKVNPVQWKLIEKDMRDKTLEFCKKGAYDDGIAWLKTVPRIREYSTVLDGRLVNVKAELENLSVDAKDVQPIVEKTKEMMRVAAKIYDGADKTTNTVSSVASNADFEAYEARLKEYRDTLVRYNCTDVDADKIIAAFKKDTQPLLDPLNVTDFTERSFLYLGTAAVNKRIDAYAKRLAKWLERKYTLRDDVAALIAAGKFDEARKLLQEDVDAVTISPQVKTTRSVKGESFVPTALDLVFEGEMLRGKVAKLTKDEKFVEARELIWGAIYPATNTVLSTFLRPIGNELMQTCVNPANWVYVENSISNKVSAFVKEGSYTNAVAWLEQYPLVKVYAGEVDDKLGAVAAEAMKLGVDSKVVSPAVNSNEGKTAEVENIVDRTDEIKNLAIPGRKIKVDRFEELLGEYRTVLLKNGCTTNNADMLVAEFREAMEPHFKSLSEGTVEQVLHLGCNGLNERIKAYVASKIEEVNEAKLYEVKMQARIDDLVKRVIALVKEEQFAQAREAIRDVELVKNAKWDAKMYAARIGLLNSIVNPRQYEKLAAEIEQKVKAFLEKEDYEGLKAFAQNYPYVRDTYQQILDELEQIKSAMLEMPIREPKTVEYVEELRKQLNAIMEKRVGALDYNHDFTALEKAFQELQQSYVEQHYSEMSAKSVCDCIRDEVKKLLGKELEPLTTWEMNARLKAPLALAMRGLAYMELLAEIDAEVSYDAQIAMAEDAIAKQLGIKCPSAYLEMNAVLGNYARILRLMKRGAVVSMEDATTLLVGATYLGQVAMFKRALELKADVNAPALRDPRGRPAILVAIETGNMEFLRLILAANGLLTVTDADGNTVLHYAMKNGNLAVARILAKSVDIAAVNKKGETALFTAVRRNQAKPVEFLINLIEADDEDTTASKRRAFVNLKSQAGEDVFTAACRADAYMLLDLLYAIGAKFDTSHLIEAGKSNNIAIAQWLVEHGADVNAEGVMAAAFGSPDDEDTVTYKYLVREGGVPLKRTPKCCKEMREALKKKAAEDQASVVGNITFDVKQNK